MKVFLIILAVLFVLICLIMMISAEFTIIFDNGWSTKLRILFFEMDIKLTKLLSFIIAPDKAGEEAAEKSKEKRKDKKKDDERQDTETADIEPAQSPEVEKSEEEGEVEAQATVNEKAPQAEITQVAEVEEISEKEVEEKPKKKNPIQKILDDDGVVGILLLVSNLLQTVNSAATTLIKGLHIYSLYVKMIIGGGDAASIAEKYGSICGWYYPLKGMIFNQLKVDNYDDYIVPDFIAPRSEYEFQFIGSISVGLLFKVLLKAGKTFLVNYFKNR